jgi:hypothetical protein
MVCDNAELTKTANLLAGVKIRLGERKRGIKGAFGPEKETNL